MDGVGVCGASLRILRTGMWDVRPEPMELRRRGWAGGSGGTSWHWSVGSVLPSAARMPSTRALY